MPKNNWTICLFRYTGQIALPTARLYHCKARVYDPAQGRFLQTDPVGYEDDMNLYDYVGKIPSTQLILRKLVPTQGAANDVFTAYDLAGRVKSERLGGTGSPGIVYGYDPADRLTGLAHDFNGSANDVSWTFGYNPARQTISRANSNALFDWTNHVAGTVSVTPPTG
jgi:RHS repeat-associated protein